MFAAQCLKNLQQVKQHDLITEAEQENIAVSVSVRCMYQSIWQQNLAFHSGFDS